MGDYVWLLLLCEKFAPFEVDFIEMLENERSTWQRWYVLVLIQIFNWSDSSQDFETILVHAISEELNETGHHLVKVRFHLLCHINEVMSKNIVYVELLTRIFTLVYEVHSPCPEFSRPANVCSNVGQKPFDLFVVQFTYYRIQTLNIFLTLWGQLLLFILVFWCVYFLSSRVPALFFHLGLCHLSHLLRVEVHVRYVAKPVQGIRLAITAFQVFEELVFLL